MSTFTPDADSTGTAHDDFFIPGASITATAHDKKGNPARVNDRHIGTFFKKMTSLAATAAATMVVATAAINPALAQESGVQIRQSNTNTTTAIDQPIAWQSIRDQAWLNASPQFKKSVSSFKIDAEASDGGNDYPALYHLSTSDSQVSCHISMINFEETITKSSLASNENAARPDNLARQQEMLLKHELAHCQHVAAIKHAEHTGIENTSSRMNRYFTAFASDDSIFDSSSPLHSLTKEVQVDTFTLLASANKHLQDTISSAELADGLKRFDQDVASLLDVRRGERILAAELGVQFNDHDTFAEIKAIQEMVHRKTKTSDDLGDLRQNIIHPDKSLDYATLYAVGSVRYRAPELHNSIATEEIRGKHIAISFFQDALPGLTETQKQLTTKQDNLGQHKNSPEEILLDIKIDEAKLQIKNSKTMIKLATDDIEQLHAIKSQSAQTFWPVDQKLPRDLQEYLATADLAFQAAQPEAMHAYIKESAQQRNAAAISIKLPTLVVASDAPNTARPAAKPSL